LDYRYFLLGGHYRSQLHFSYESLNTAKNSRKSLVEKIKSLADKIGYDGTQNISQTQSAKAPQSSYTDLVDTQGLEKNITNYIEAFDKAIQDDLNTPRALAELWGLLKDSPASVLVLEAVFDMDKVLGLGLKDSLDKKNKESNIEDKDFVQEIEGLIAKRAQAKKTKDFTAADNIRQNLKERGIILEDSPSGTTWKRS